MLLGRRRHRGGGARDFMDFDYAFIVISFVIFFSIFQVCRPHDQYGSCNCEYIMHYFSKEHMTFVLMHWDQIT